MRVLRLRPNKRFRLLLMGVLVAVIMFTVSTRVATIWQLSARKQGLLLEKQRLALLNEEYRQRLAETESPLGIERIAREQLGMVKKGERAIIRIIPND